MSKVAWPITYEMLETAINQVRGEISEREKRQAWDAYFAANLAICNDLKIASYQADLMMEVRDKRFPGV